MAPASGQRRESRLSLNTICKPPSSKDDELEQTLDALIPNRVGTAVRIVTALGRYDQQQFLRLLRKSTSRTASLAIPDAEGIGRLVLERRWEDVAADLVGQYRIRTAGPQTLRSEPVVTCSIGGNVFFLGWYQSRSGRSGRLSRVGCPALPRRSGRSRIVGACRWRRRRSVNQG